MGVNEVLEGKRVLLVEDSIVRATTLKALLERVWVVGRPREIHVRVACPPIISPCFYGIDMSTVTELFAPQFLNGGPMTPEIEARIYATARDFHGFAPMQRCPIPLLLIFGEKTDSPGIALKDRIAAASPHRRVVVVPGASHFLPMERPEETARIALQFLAAE
jgi:pimeloyl-ACP methyl ester carboxylesterase